MRVYVLAVGVAILLDISMGVYLSKDYNNTSKFEYDAQY